MRRRYPKYEAYDPQLSYEENWQKLIMTLVDSSDDLYKHIFSSSSAYMADTKGLDLAWVVEDFLPETYLAVIGAASNGGKSCLVTALAIAVASGEPFLGLKTAKAPVLWVAYEESRQERNLALGAFPTVPDNLYITHDRLYIDTKHGIDTLRWWIRKTRAKLVVIDPLYAACVAESLSDGRKARETLMGLK